MAGYAFETISASQAASFGTDDFLFFLDSNASANEVQVTPFSNGSLGTGIQLSYGGRNVVFPNTIATASRLDHIQFGDNSHLQIGTDAAQTGTSTDGTTGANTGAFTQVGNTPNTVYALNGADTIDFSGSTIAANYLNGGFGQDTIMGGNANNHIYGNTQFGANGSTDQGGNPDMGDTITVGTGTNFINGNAGNDQITINGGANTNGTGSNRVFGGADDDTVTINGAGANSVNGNLGNDRIDGSAATFNNTLRGGQDNDTIIAGHGHDGIMGDLGDDSLVAGSNTNGQTNGGHLTTMTGGDGSDVFDFSGATSAQGMNGSLGTNIAGQNYYQTVTDFAQGTDQIGLAFHVEANDLVHGDSGATFTTVSAAANYAQGLLANHTQAGGTDDTTGAANGEIAAVQVGNDTYLFFNHTGTGQIDSTIHLSNVDQMTLNQGSSNSNVDNGGNDFIVGNNGTTTPMGGGMGGGN